MSYTMSFDASLKLKAGDVGGYLMHFDRDAGQEQLRHKNPNIDTALAVYNQTLFYNQDTGEFEVCADREQIKASLYKRLENVSKPLRKDATVARGIVLQLDPEYYKDNHIALDSEQNEKAAEDMLQWAVKTFGKQNIIAASVHNDEASPHMHIMFCPVTDDGRLSQKDWFASPAALRSMHQDLRSHMADSGYDIDFERKKPGKHAKRMKESEYRDYKQLCNMQAGLDARETALNAREATLRQQMVLQTENQKKLDSRAQELAEREHRLEEREQNYKLRSEIINKCLKNANELVNDCLESQKENLRRRYDDVASMAEDIGIYDNQVGGLSK